MKPNELRLGNYVNYEQTTHYITQLRQKRVFTRYNNQDILEIDYECEYDSIKPIPLTEEWLLKFGLMSIKTELGLWNNGDAIYFNCGFEKSIQLKYVHQLQNLYFALTGEELNFKSE